MIIKVTKKHIKNGNRHSIYSCPVALAIQEELGYPDFSSICVGNDNFMNKDTYRIVSSPRSVQRFIAKYDTYEEVSPFNFRFDYGNFLKKTLRKGKK